MMVIQVGPHLTTGISGDLFRSIRQTGTARSTLESEVQAVRTATDTDQPFSTGAASSWEPREFSFLGHTVEQMEAGDNSAVMRIVSNSNSIRYSRTAPRDASGYPVDRRMRAPTTTASEVMRLAYATNTTYPPPQVETLPDVTIVNMVALMLKQELCTNQGLCFEETL